MIYNTLTLTCLDLFQLQHSVVSNQCKWVMYVNRVMVIRVLV
jgi:hypothetical protein